MQSAIQDLDWSERDLEDEAAEAELEELPADEGGKLSWSRLKEATENVRQCGVG